MERLVIIPTYNEKENIEAIITAVMNLPLAFEVLVIDDGSPDGTADIVKSLMAGKYAGRVHLVERKGKLGLGTAYITGFKWAIEHKAEYIFEMDADFSHNPQDLLKLYDACANEGADLAIGSRYVTGVNVVNWPMGRVLMSYFASKYVRFVLRMPVCDTTAGFVCYRRRVLETIELDKIRFKGYAFQIEMKFTAYKCGFRIKEVPIIFVNRVLGTSKMSGGIFSEALLGVIRLKYRLGQENIRKDEGRRMKDKRRNSFDYEGAAWRPHLLASTEAQTISPSSFVVHRYSFLLFLFSLFCCLLLSGCGQRGEGRCEEETPCGDSVFVRYEYGIPIDSFRVDTGYVREGETLGGILRRCGATAQQMSGVLTLDKAQFDVRQIRAGKRYLALYQPDSLLRYWVYQPDIRTAKVLHLIDSLHVEHHEKPITLVERTAQATIESSLWNAMVENDLPVDLALELSEIYAWTIDFFGLQKGDSVRVYYEEQFVDSTRVGIGSIYAAHFYHGRRWQEAYWFENEAISGYFDEQGNSLRKAFLKAPLNYKRISSRFTYARKHPIYKIVRPHTGVDYAAPAGTPVVSIGDGTVVEKGYKGGGGHTVKIRHNSTYTTAYLHLSKYAKNLRVGERVKQGEVIGYVGSSGASTGPHLDFRVWKNGTPIDPLKMESPPVEPVPAKYKAEFDSTTQILKKKLYNL